MDLKSFYKKIDVDSIKSKLPPMPQIKIPKIKSRKIFKSSREDVSQGPQSQGGTPVASSMTMGAGAGVGGGHIPQSSSFINRTPTRISTVSSLMNINNPNDDAYKSESTYRTANNFEAENCPDRETPNVDAPPSGSAASKFTNKCKKTYKDFSEFKFKGIFNRKTVVRKTEIDVDIYAQQYKLESEEERQQDMRDDRDYEIVFKEARRNSLDNSISPPDSASSSVEPSPERPKLAQLQRNPSPPSVKKTRNKFNSPRPSMEHSISEESQHEPPQKPNRSTLWNISNKDNPDSETQPTQAKRVFRKTKRVQAPKECASASSDQDQPEEKEKKRWKLSNVHLRRADSSEKVNDSQISSPEGTFSNIKKSIKRLQQKKTQPEPTEESETEVKEPKPNVSDQLKAQFNRLKLKDRSSSVNVDETTSPHHNQSASNKFSEWKKNFQMKRSIEESPTQSTATPPPPGRSLTLMRKLNHIRSKKVVSEDEGDDSSLKGEQQQKPKSTNMEKFEQARDKAVKKVNEQVLKLKNFHGKAKDAAVEQSPDKPPKVQKADSEDQPCRVITELPRSTPAMWTTNQAISQSLDSSDESETPRVLIHQDNSDQFESTLIVAVTRPAPAIPPPAPPAVIHEIFPKPKHQTKSEWIPNKNAVSSFLEMTPSPDRTTHYLDVQRGHSRKRSMDSNDSDSWIPETYRYKNCSSSTSAGLNRIHENSEPWKVHTVFRGERIHKTKSIDIFTHPDSSAFDDFDHEMRNVPITPIARIARASVDSLNKSYAESTDDEDDYDNSSRITRVKRPSPQVNTTTEVHMENASRPESVNNNNISESRERRSPLVTQKGQTGNSQESLDANYDENEIFSSNDDDDILPGAPSPPPSFSPPPPPLPLRKLPRAPPERNDSMVRLANPLVKQASLRRHFSEEIEPADMGKVNKLISRFEKNDSQDNTSSTNQRIQVIVNDNEIDFDEEEEKQIQNQREKEQEKEKEKQKIQNKQKDHDIPPNGNKKRPAPIPIPQQPTTSAKQIEDSRNNNICNNYNNLQPEKHRKRSKATPSPEVSHRKNPEDNVSMRNANSEYGSPIGSTCPSERISSSSEYGSPIGMVYPPKATEQFRIGRRLSNRSSLRDDDMYYSFDSDEENSFYSFGDSSCTKYKIDI